jgi:hypothetical protein
MRERKSTSRTSHPPPAGYSGTPLAKKLGIGTGCEVLALGAPREYERWLTPLPEGVRFTARARRTTELAHVFVTRRSDLEKRLATLRRQLPVEVPVWVSWPKKISGVATDIVEGTIREVAIPLGYVDIKVCAVSEVWSGLKLVVRKELR